jgi:chromosomal replication initiator protein
MELEKIWDATLKELEKYVGKLSLEMFKSIKPLKIEEDVLTLDVPSTFAKTWLEDRHKEQVEEIIKNILNKKITLKFISLPKEELKKPEEFYSLGEEEEKNISNLNLNPRYTFENFVVGNSNRLCHAASIAVASSPGKAYNPLFIYGGAGLGKTHLLQAIAHYVIDNHKNIKISYVNSETFTNELINAITQGQKKIDEFRIQYRNIDMLLIDDIQFIIGKERTQEEFFHTFNTLYDVGKQIVISSDRPPKDFTQIEERLRSRFSWGLIADIQPPDLETRIAILKRKKSPDIEISEEVLIYIAQEIPSNIRELEGALIRLIAEATSHNIPITLSLAQDVLKDIFPAKGTKQISILKIQEAVADYFNLRVSDLISSRRTKHQVIPRQIAMYLARVLTDASFVQIGEEFGGRDHTTAMHAYEKISQEINNNPELEKIIQEINNKLRG